MSAAGFTPIQLYRSTTASAVPTSGNLADGELAINTNDGKLYYKDSGGTVQLIASKAGASGDVVGPASATDNAVVRFDGSTGKLVQNSVVTIADSTGDISGVGQLNATTVDTTNVEVTNIKAKDGTAAATIADSTGVVSITANPVLSGGTANGVLYLNGSKVATSGSALTFDGTNLGVGTANPASLTGGASTGVAFNGSSSVELDFATAGVRRGYFYADSNAAEVGTVTGSIPIKFAIGLSETMRLTSTGLGIGTSSPVGRLTIQGAAGTSGINQGIGLLYSNGTQYGALGLNNSTGWPQLMARAGAGLTFHVNSDLVTTGEVMRLDSSGNLGLGVTPSAFSVGKAIQIGATNGITLFGFAGGAEFGSNFNFDSSYKYIATGEAARYTTGGGIHAWYNAPSGTAGNAITFTQAMTLDSSGNLGLGTTGQTSTYSARLASVSAGGAAALALDAPTGFNTSINFYNNGAAKWTTQVLPTGEYRWYDFVASTERARITSGGEVYIAGTTDQGAYNLQVNGTGVWGAGAYVNGSDERLKDNIQTLNDGLAVVSQLRPVTFQYKPEHSKDQSVQPGFIAQELQQAMAGKNYVDGVVQSGPEYLNVAYQNLIPILTKAIQEQQALITSLTARVALLEGN